MLIRSVAACVAFSLLAMGTAGAQTDAAATPQPSPLAAPSATPAPMGFSAKGHFTVTVPVNGTALPSTVHLSVAQLDQLLRIDVMSVESFIMPIPIADIAFVIDRGANRLTILNTRTKTYASQAFLPASMFGGGGASPAPTRRRPRAPQRSMLADIDLLTFDLRLTGHTMTAGIPTTGIAMQAKVRRHGAAAVGRFSVNVQLADAYALFPMLTQGTFQVNAGAAPVAFTFAVDSFSTAQPPAELFAIPAGYTSAPIAAVATGRAAAPASTMVMPASPMPMSSKTPSAH